MKNGTYKLCFVGHMIGRNPGYVTTQGQVLSDLFEEAGYQVVSVSSKISRIGRMADIVKTLIQQRHKTDVMILEIYAGLSLVLEDVASFLGKLFGIRIVMWLHGGDIPRFMETYPNWMKRVLKRADLLITPSPFLARAIENHGFQSRVIPNVIDIKDYPYRQRTQTAPRLFWMRSFHPVWNPIMALRVLENLRQSIPEATLVMAGADKGYEAEVKEMAHELKLDNTVRFAGFLNQNEKLMKADEADIFINTNHVDNMPVSIIEACALGLPVVTTDVGGIPDLLTDGKTGLLVPDDGVEEMVAAIKRLLNDNDLTSRLSENGRQLAKRSSWEEVQPQWEQVFADVTQKRDSQKAKTFIGNEQEIKLTLKAKN